MTISSKLILAAALTLSGAVCLAKPVQSIHKDALPKGFTAIIKTDDGCGINNPYPKAGESISWSGECVDGLAQGYGVLQWYQDGIPTDNYAGEYRAGRLNGLGQYTWRDGIMMTGVWKDDKAEGLHEIIMSQGDSKGDVYIGQLKDGMRQGRGVYYFYRHNPFFKRNFDDLPKFDVAGDFRWIGDYLLADIVSENGNMVAVCGIQEHPEC